MHTVSLLKEGGMLGYVISSSWLDVAFGTGLQKFILDNFKLVAVIDNQKTRSFETASINTVILIMEKCSDRRTRENNEVKFVRVFKDYDELIGNSNYADRFQYLERFVNNIKKTKKKSKNDIFQITVRNQKELKEESTLKGKYENGNWGAKYLRSPEIYDKIIEIAGSKLIPLRKVCTVGYGIKTGANEFFYIKDDNGLVGKMTDDEFKLHFGHERTNSRINWKKFGWYYSEMSNKHYLLERFYFRPLFKTQREADKLEVDPQKLNYQVLICNESKLSLRKVNAKIIKYIEEGESLPYKFDKRPSCSSRIREDGTQDWFNLGDDLSAGEFIFPSKIGERFRLIDNRKSNVYCDKVNYNISVKPESINNSDIIFLLLNSTLFRYLLDLFSRQMVVKVSDVDVNVVEKTLIPNPELFIKYDKEILELINKLKSREQKPIYEEVKYQDRNKLDQLIFEVLGLSNKDLDKLYEESCNYVRDRRLKSESLVTQKAKKIVDYETSLRLAEDRFDEIQNYYHLIEDLEVKPYIYYNLPAIFPKDIISGDTNMFSTYKIFFKDGNKTTTINFENNNQIQLYQFFYKKLEFREGTINLPLKAEYCSKVLKKLEYDFNKYAQQIKNLLKTHRSKAHYLSIYRDIVMKFN